VHFQRKRLAKNLLNKNSCYVSPSDASFCFTILIPYYGLGHRKVEVGPGLSRLLRRHEHKLKLLLMSMSMGWDYVSELRPPMGVLFIPQVIYEYTKSHGGMILTGENERTLRKTCPNATLSTTNITWTDPFANPGLRDDWPATKRLSDGTALTAEV
jgi:hypothetical protein